MKSMVLLSNLTSLTSLKIINCRNLTHRSQSKKLEVYNWFTSNTLAADLLSEVARTKLLLAGSFRLEKLEVYNISELRPWRGLDMQLFREDRQVFDASTKMVLGDRTSVLFWEDRWLDGKSLREIAPDLFALILRHSRKRRMVRQALVERSWITDITGALSALAFWQYIQMWIRLRDMQLMTEPDMLVWRWTTDTQYSSRSCYNILFQGAIVLSSWRINWRSWAAPRMKFFIWLACQDRCWTGEQLVQRGLPHPTTCSLCD
jgi:hypothetical protein